MASLSHSTSDKHSSVEEYNCGSTTTSELEHVNNSISANTQAGKDETQSTCEAGRDLKDENIDRLKIHEERTNEENAINKKRTDDENESNKETGCRKDNETKACYQSVVDISNQELSRENKECTAAEHLTKDFQEQVEDYKKKKQKVSVKCVNGRIIKLVAKDNQEEVCGNDKECITFEGATKVFEKQLEAATVKMKTNRAIRNSQRICKYFKCTAKLDKVRKDVPVLPVLGIISFKFIDFEKQFGIDEKAFKISRSPNHTHSQRKLSRWRQALEKENNKKSVGLECKAQKGDMQQEFRHLYKINHRLKSKRLGMIKSKPDSEFSQDSLDEFWLQVEEPERSRPPNEGEKHQSSEAESPRCDFCENSAVYFCENCSYYYCEASLGSLHPAVGPFQSHIVIPATFAYSYGYQRCKSHGLPEKVFCRICMRKRCVDCVNTSCQLHFLSLLTNKDIDKEKAILLADMEKLTKAIGSLNVYENQVDDETMETEMLALYQRERIRQEFVSFHELLIDSEALLCEQLDQEVNRRLSGIWRGKEAELTGLRKDEAELTSVTVDLLQTDDKDDFVTGTGGIHERYTDMHRKISDFHTAWAKGSIEMEKERTGILGQPFSLFLEKKKFNENIQQFADGGPRITFRQKTLLITDLAVPVMIEKLVTETNFGPSTTVKYELELLYGPRQLLWKTETDSLKGLQLNILDTFKFQNGHRYLLKLHPTLLFHTSDCSKQMKEIPSAHLLIVVQTRVNISRQQSPQSDASE